MSKGYEATPVIKIKVDRSPYHAYLTFYGKSHDGDTFGFSGQICLLNAEADVLLENINRNTHVIVEVVTKDTAVSGYSFGPEPPAYDPPDYVCECCGRPEEGPHATPCEMEAHDLELIAAEMAERECLDGYDVADAMTTSERWVSGL